MSEFIFGRRTFLSLNRCMVCGTAALGDEKLKQWQIIDRFPSLVFSFCSLCDDIGSYSFLRGQVVLRAYYERAGSELLPANTVIDDVPRSSGQPCRGIVQPMLRIHPNGQPAYLVELEDDCYKLVPLSQIRHHIDPTRQTLALADLDLWSRFDKLAPVPQRLDALVRQVLLL